MRVVILTYGSRGDVQPYLALALALQDTGCQVRVAATGDYPCPAFPHLSQGTPRWLETAYNRLTHAAFERTFWWGNHLAYHWLVRPEFPDLPRRPEWPFAPSVDPPTPVLFGYSEHVLPRPSAWGPHTHVTGYWTLDPESDAIPGPLPIPATARTPRRLAAAIDRALQDRARGSVRSPWGRRCRPLASSGATSAEFLAQRKA